MADDNTSMVSMKRTPKEIKEEETVEWTPPEYPYGLELRLGNDEMEKLGMNGIPEVGAKVNVSGAGEITGAHMSKRAGEPDHRSMTIQITDMAVPVTRTIEDMAKNIFDGGEK